MAAKELTRDRVESLASSLGAKDTTILKWRYRGVPSGWQLRIVAASKGRITVKDMFDYAAAMKSKGSQP